MNCTYTAPVLVYGILGQLLQKTHSLCLLTSLLQSCRVTESYI